jgi:DNA-binding NarL/FixJ family response regulator
MIRVLIVDAQAEVRWGLRMRLSIEPDIAIVGDTDNADEAIALAQALDPDAIVVDIGIGDTDGAKMVKHLRSAAPAALVIVLTLRGDEDTRVRAHQAGAQAFLEKRGGAADLLQAIRELSPHELLETDFTAARQ